MAGVRRRGPHRSQRKTRETTEGQQACAAEGGKAVQATSMPAKRNAGAARSSHGIKPTAAEAMMSIESLYVESSNHLVASLGSAWQSDMFSSRNR